MTRQQALAVALDGAEDDGTGRVALPAGRLLSAWCPLGFLHRSDIAGGAAICWLVERSIAPLGGSEPPTFDAHYRTRAGGLLSTTHDDEATARAWCDAAALADGWTLIGLLEVS